MPTSEFLRFYFLTPEGFRSLATHHLVYLYNQAQTYFAGFVSLLTRGRAASRGKQAGKIHFRLKIE